MGKNSTTSSVNSEAAATKPYQVSSVNLRVDGKRYLAGSIANLTDVQAAGVSTYITEVSQAPVAEGVSEQ